MKKTTRVHIAVNVRSMEESASFYNHLFDCTPSRIANDQLDWIINEPPIHFSIYSNDKYPYGVEHIGFDMPQEILSNFRQRINTEDNKTHDPDKLKIELYTSEFN